MMVTGSASRTCGPIERDSLHARKDLVKEKMRRRSGPVLLNSVTQGCVATADQGRRAVFHHRDQFRRGLAEIQRNDNQAFGHRSQVDRHPANAVRRQQSTAVAFLQSLRGKKSSRLANQLEKFAARHSRDLAVADFLQHRGVRGRL